MTKINLPAKPYVIERRDYCRGGSKLKIVVAISVNDLLGLGYLKIKWSPFLSTLFPLRGGIHIPQHWNWANLCLHGLKSVKVTLYDFPGSSGFFLFFQNMVCQYVPFWGTPTQNLACCEKPTPPMATRRWSLWAQLSPVLGWSQPRSLDMWMTKASEDYDPTICVSLPQYWDVHAAEAPYAVVTSQLCADSIWILAPQNPRAYDRVLFYPLSLGWFTGQ